MRIAIGVAYDGRHFHGWQVQSELPTVQGALGRALSGVAGHPVAVTGAGRTDAAVHALGQVAHFDTSALRPESAWVRGTNSALPSSIAVQWARPVAASFHARFSAVSRTYCYVLHNHAIRPALFAGQVGWFHLPLDVDAMQAGARYLVGRHDFSSFRAAECQAGTPVRDLQVISVARVGSFIVFHLRADAFLHHMVRNIVGALIYVGKGRHAPSWIGQLLTCRDRRLAAPTFSAEGLYLVRVGYDPQWGIVEPDSESPWFVQP